MDCVRRMAACRPMFGSLTAGEGNDGLEISPDDELGGTSLGRGQTHE
jgi:hypothetical protein